MKTHGLFSNNGFCSISTPTIDVLRLIGRRPATSLSTVSSLPVSCFTPATITPLSCQMMNGRKFSSKNLYPSVSHTNSDKHALLFFSYIITCICLLVLVGVFHHKNMQSKYTYHAMGNIILWCVHTFVSLSLSLFLRHRELRCRNNICYL